MNRKKLIKQIVVIFAGVLNKIGLDIPSVPSAAAIIVRGNKILLVKLSYKDGYALPGGAVMRGENLEQAVKREVKEETGFNVVALEYFGSYAVVRSSHYSFNVTYLAKVKGKLKSSFEGEAKWVTINQVIDNLVYEDNRNAVKQYLKEVKIE
jgi:ADP-ribose pyrophosphatase YjhB (NUDIX family)